MADIGIKDGVRVNAINPGLIETERFTRNIERTMRNRSSSRDEAIAYLLVDRLGTTRVGRPEEIGCDDGVSGVGLKADYAARVDYHRCRWRRDALALIGGQRLRHGIQIRRRSPRDWLDYAVTTSGTVARWPDAVRHEALRSLFNVVGLRDRRRSGMQHGLTSPTGQRLARFAGSRSGGHCSAAAGARPMCCTPR